MIYRVHEILLTSHGVLSDVGNVNGINICMRARGYGDVQISDEWTGEIGEGEQLVRDGVAREEVYRHGGEDFC